SAPPGCRSHCSSSARSVLTPQRSASPAASRPPPDMPGAIPTGEDRETPAGKPGGEEEANGPRGEAEMKRSTAADRAAVGDRSGTGWTLAAATYVFAVVMIGTTLPTPLYPR